MIEENVNIPLFGNAVRIKKHYGLSLPRLAELVAAGAVKTIKFGASKQAGRLYSTKDIEKALERMAVGKNVIRRSIVNQTSGESRNCQNQTSPASVAGRGGEL